MDRTRELVQHMTDSEIGTLKRLGDTALEAMVEYMLSYADDINKAQPGHQVHFRNLEKFTKEMHDKYKQLKNG